MIHETAIISKEADIDPTAEIGAYAIVEGKVRIGPRCRVAPHAQLVGDVRLGEGVSIGRGAVIGEDPQDHSFQPEMRSGVEIGAGTSVREHVTIHRGGAEGGLTRVGERNFLMVGCHLAHDVQIGDDNVLANGVLLAGHCVLGNRIFLGGGTVVHQFIRIGDLAISQGNSSISMDVPPFSLVGLLNVLFGLNVVGLRRAGVSREVRSELKNAYKQVYRSKKIRGEALSETDWVKSDEAAQFFAFFREPSKKGVCAPGRR